MTQLPEALQRRLEEAHEAANAKEFARAEALLVEVLEATPNELSALDLLGFVLFFQGRPEQAEVACRRALAIEPERAYSTKGLGLCLARQGRVDEGVLLLRQAIALAPKWFDPRWDLGVVLADAGRWDEATEVLQQAEGAVPAERSRFASLRAGIAKRRVAVP